MNTPTPFRLAVNHLKSLGIIRRDNELLPTLGMTSKGALAAYIGGKPPKHIIDKFLNKYGEHVAQFFTEEEESKRSVAKTEKPIISNEEYVSELRSDKERYIRIIETNLASLNMSLAKLVQIQEKISSGADENQLKKTTANVDPKALNPDIPFPPLDSSAEHQSEEEGSQQSHAKGKGHRKK